MGSPFCTRLYHRTGPALKTLFINNAEGLMQMQEAFSIKPSALSLGTNIEA
jgi:hypothetical protein